jgi:ABC-type multidrug transport system ATPase subunit
MAEVERLADRVILLREGRIIEDASPRALIKASGRKTLEEVFLQIVRRPREAAGKTKRGEPVTLDCEATIAAAEAETGTAPRATP